jgi:hypothetical protein
MNSLILDIQRFMGCFCLLNVKHYKLNDNSCKTNGEWNTGKSVEFDRGITEAPSYKSVYILYTLHRSLNFTEFYSILKLLLLLLLLLVVVVVAVALSPSFSFSNCGDYYSEVLQFIACNFCIKLRRIWPETCIHWRFSTEDCPAASKPSEGRKKQKK